jgi:hypothetical protein
VLEQLIYKWRNTRRTLAPILAASYRLVIEDGRKVTRREIQRDVGKLLRYNFEKWIGPGFPPAKFSGDARETPGCSM